MNFQWFQCQTVDRFCIKHLQTVLLFGFCALSRSRLRQIARIHAYACKSWKHTLDKRPGIKCVTIFTWFRRLFHPQHFSRLQITYTHTHTRAHHKICSHFLFTLLSRLFSFHFIQFNSLPFSPIIFHVCVISTAMTISFLINLLLSLFLCGTNSHCVECRGCRGKIISKKKIMFRSFQLELLFTALFGVYKNNSCIRFKRKRDALKVKETEGKKIH